MEAYCVKCRAKREMANAKQVFMKNGKPAITGTCSVCGTQMFRIGQFESLPIEPKIKVDSFTLTCGKCGKSHEFKKDFRFADTPFKIFEDEYGDAMPWIVFKCKCGNKVDEQ